MFTLHHTITLMDNVMLQRNITQTDGPQSVLCILFYVLNNISDIN